MNQHHRYLIVQNSEPRMEEPARMLIYGLMFLLALTYFAIYAYELTEPDPFLDQTVEWR